MTARAATLGNHARIFIQIRREETQDGRQVDVPDLSCS
jgi:hypothetical protein